jgi:hypothetical protein
VARLPTCATYFTLKSCVSSANTMMRLLPSMQRKKPHTQRITHGSAAPLRRSPAVSPTTAPKAANASPSRMRP